MTTDEMDSTTPEERYKLVAICGNCHKPHCFTGSHKRFTQTSGEKHICGGTSFYGMQSQRTFDPLKPRKKPKKRK